MRYFFSNFKSYVGGWATKIEQNVLCNINSKAADKGEEEAKKLPASDGQKCTNGFFRQLHTKLSLVAIAGYHIEAFLIGNSRHCVI